MATVLKMQNPIALAGTAWCPGGRQMANAEGTTPGALLLLLEVSLALLLACACARALAATTVSTKASTEPAACTPASAGGGAWRGERAALPPCSSSRIRPASPKQAHRRGVAPGAAGDVGGRSVDLHMLAVARRPLRDSLQGPHVPLVVYRQNVGQSGWLVPRQLHQLQRARTQRDIRGMDLKMCSSAQPPSPHHQRSAPYLGGPCGRGEPQSLQGG